MLTRSGSGPDTVIPVPVPGCCRRAWPVLSVGFAHPCSLAAVVCGSHRGYPARHPEVFPYSAGNDPAVAGEEPAEAEDEPGRAAPEPAQGQQPPLHAFEGFTSCKSSITPAT